MQILCRQNRRRVRNFKLFLGGTKLRISALSLQKNTTQSHKQYMSVQDKHRRLWRPAVATHPRTQQIEYDQQVPRSGTYIMKPTASCEAAQLWVRAILPPHIVPRRGTDASCMMLRTIVGPASRNQGRVSGRLSHSCAPSELAVGF